jgi:hypothetical protein
MVLWFLNRWVVLSNAHSLAYSLLSLCCSVLPRTLQSTPAPSLQSTYPRTPYASFAHPSSITRFVGSCPGCSHAPTPCINRFRHRLRARTEVRRVYLTGLVFAPDAASMRITGLRVLPQAALFAQHHSYAFRPALSARTPSSALGLSRAVHQQLQAQLERHQPTATPRALDCLGSNFEAAYRATPENNPTTLAAVRVRCRPLHAPYAHQRFSFCGVSGSGSLMCSVHARRTVIPEAV